MIRISWSGLRVHDECKQQSHLARKGNLAALDNKRGFFPGTVTDRVVRNWLNDDPLNNLNCMPDMVDHVIDVEKAALAENNQGVVRWKDREDREQVRTDCIEAVTKIQPSLLKYVVPFEYEPDHHFESPVQIRFADGERATVLLNGYIDILVRDDKGRFWIWDVKHTRDNGYWRKTIGQLGFYDLAIELKFGQPAVQTGLLQPLCTQPVWPYKPSADSRLQLLQRVQGMAFDVRNNVATPREDTTMCVWCSTKNACVKFQPVLDKNGHKRVAF